MIQKKQPTKKFRKITLDMVLASTSLTRSSKETAEAYLQRVTHLHLQAKRIRVIENLDLCTNLKVLYLYDNFIEVIENLSFATILQYLYLQNNYIKSVPHLPMPSLRKIYLDENEITIVNGLDDCFKLEELHVAKQRLPTYTSLSFDPNSLIAISKSLQVLEISGNFISLLTPFKTLFNLRKMFCRDNNIIDLSEVEAVVGLPKLEEADFTGNPCCKLFKYRDVVIAASSDYFKILDEVPVPKHQQIAIKGLVEHRKKIGALSNMEFHINNGSSTQSDLFPEYSNQQEENM